MNIPNDRGAVKGKWANTVDDETSALHEGFQLLKDRDVDADDGDICVVQHELLCEGTELVNGPPCNGIFDFRAFWVLLQVAGDQTT
jgi:hypothetical protein